MLAIHGVDGAHSAHDETALRTKKTTVSDEKQKDSNLAEATRETDESRGLAIVSVS
jgi:hypothetical protein